MAINQTEFRSALSRFPSGVTVVTSIDADGGLHGITVSAFSSVSLDPPQVLVCIEKTAGSHHAFQISRPFVVNILNSDQSGVSQHFASHIADKFSGVDVRAGIDGVPVIEGCLVNLECRVTNAYDGGDHTIFTGEVENVSMNDGEPLVYYHGNYRTIAAHATDRSV